VIPRHVLERAHGFAIFTVAKAGFLFSARAGSGIVIAKLDDGSEYLRGDCGMEQGAGGKSTVMAGGKAAHLGVSKTAWSSA